jgi:hypothetical protein
MNASVSRLGGHRVRRSGELATGRRMVTVTWVQHRSAVLAFSLLAAAAALVAALAGVRGHATWASLASCPVTGKCLADATMFLQKPWGPYPVVMSAVLVVLVLLFGVFLAAPLLAAEFESGTFRFAWTQAFGRRTWLTWKLGLLGGSCVVLAAGLGALFSWSYQPWALAGAASGWSGLLFQASPLTLAGWAFLAMMLGALIGAVTRKTVPAMAWSGIALLAAMGAAWSQATGLLGLAVSTTVAAPAVQGAASFQGPLDVAASPGSGRLSGAWLVRGWFTGHGGHPVTTAALRQINGDMPAQAAGQLRWLNQHHEEYHLAYQPASALGVFQGCEALLLIIAGLLCLALMRRLVRARSMRKRAA